MKFRFSALVVAGLAIALPAAGLGAAPGVATSSGAKGSVFSPASLKISRHVLKNGLVVILQEDHTVPTVTLWQWYKVGSRNERPGITGISHFFEHMMFNGSRNVAPKEYDRIIESNGGFSNAFTDRDMTAYYEDIASDRLEVLLRLDSDRMTELTLAPELLKSEIEVVKEERRLRTDNDIAGMLDEQLYAVAFNASPYRWPVVGWMGDLETMKREDLVEYFRVYYAPNNCILILCGDFDSKTALASIEKYFGSIPAQTPPAEPIDSEPKQRGERRVEVRYPAQNVTLMVGYKAPNVKDPDLYALDVLSSILSQGESSRLHQALVYEQQLALNVGTFFRTRLNPTLFELYAELKPEKTAAEGLEALDRVVNRMIHDGPTPREIQKAKNLLEASFVRGLKTNNGVGEQIGFYEHIFGDYKAMFRTLDKYRAVTAADVKRVAKKYLDPTQRTVAELKPLPQEATP